MPIASAAGPAQASTRPMRSWHQHSPLEACPALLCSLGRPWGGAGAGPAARSPRGFSAAAARRAGAAAAPAPRKRGCRPMQLLGCHTPGRPELPGAGGLAVNASTRRAWVCWQRCLPWSRPPPIPWPPPRPCLPSATPGAASRLRSWRANIATLPADVASALAPASAPTSRPARASPACSRRSGARCGGGAGWERGCAAADCMCIASN